jgi:uncharacterized protein (TIGR02145 family)
MEGYRIIIMGRLLLFSVLLLFDLSTTYAQKVTNITAEQVGQTIQVSYNLETQSPCTISLFYSTDNGATWQGPLKKVSVDAGEKISGGNKKITWDVLSELEQLKFSGVVFKIDARQFGLKEVKIGNQIWSAENLYVDKFANGDKIFEMKSNNDWELAIKNKEAAWCYYNNDSSLGAIYGKLYNWYAVADPRGLCPTGWHVPSDSEWDILGNYLGGRSIAGGKMKEKGLKHWASPNTGATNSSGFTGLPGGYRYRYGSSELMGNFGYWWTATQSSPSDAYYRSLDYYPIYVFRHYSYKTYYYSVRCIKD